MRCWGFLHHFPDSHSDQVGTTTVSADHHVPVSTLYAITSQEHLNMRRFRGSTLWSLSLSGLKFQYPDIPSWAIDWTVLQCTSFKLDILAWLNLYHLFQASKGLTDHDLQFRNDDMSLEGVLVDTVVSTVQLVSFRDIHRTFWLLLPRTQYSDPYPGATADNWEDAWYKIVLADSLQDRPPTTKHILRRLDDNEMRVIVSTCFDSSFQRTSPEHKDGEHMLPYPHQVVRHRGWHGSGRSAG
jgi:hypothetical protein